MTVCLPQRLDRDRVRSVLRDRWAPAALRQPWWWPAALFPAGLAVVELVRWTSSDGAAGRLTDWASTDLDNLGRNPIGSMLVSAFVIDGDPSLLGLLGWTLLAATGLGTLGRRWGAARTVALVLAAHVLGTLLSQGVTAWRLHTGVAEAAERYALDVGPSYVVVSALAAGLVAGSVWSRPVCALGLGVLAPFLFDGLGDLEVAAVGHLVAVVVGLAGAAGVTLVDITRSPGRAFAGDVPDPGR